jgi:hypothetical protein
MCKSVHERNRQTKQGQRRKQESEAVGQTFLRHGITIGCAHATATVSIGILQFFPCGAIWWRSIAL